MKSEGGEYGGTDGKDYDESKEEEYYSKEVKDLIDEVEREQELEKTNATDDPRKQDDSSEDANSSKEERETNAPEGNDQEQTETDGEYDEYWRKEAEDCVKDAVKELESEEAEAQAAREADEAEYKEFQESGREAREQSADQDNLSEWEKDVLDNLEDYGIDPEEVRERWRNQFVKDVQDELEEASDEPEPMEKEEEGFEAGEEPRHDKSEESESYHDDGSSQMYAMESESSEATESKAETEDNGGTEGAEQEAAEAPEDSISRERTEPKHDQSESEETTTQEGEETEQQPRRVAQEGTEEPESREDVLKKEAEYQKEFTRSSTPEYPDEVKEEHGGTKTERKVESSTDHEVYGHGEDASKVIEAPAKQESEEIATESELSDELSPEEEARKRVIDEIFSSLPEEVRESLRKYLEDLIEEEEDFEGLARKHGLEKLLEDEEVMEEVREFLRFKRTCAANPEASMEELAEELGIDPEQAERWTEQRFHPEAIKRVLRLEGYRILDNLIREIREQGYPEDLEEFEEFLQNNPRLEYEDPMAPYEQWKREANAWIKIMRARREGRIEFRLRHGWEIYSREQIEGLSKRNGVSKEKIISWLHGKSIPYLIKRSGSLRIVKKQKSSHLGQFGSKEEFDEFLSRNQNLMMAKSFERQYKKAKEYFDKIGPDRELEKPSLIEKCEKLDLHQKYNQIHEDPPNITLESIKDVDKLLEKYPNLKELSKFDEYYEQCKIYFQVRDDKSETQEKLARKYRTSQSSISNIQRGNEPRLMTRLRGLEEERIILEWAKNQPPKSLKGRIAKDSEKRESTRKQSEIHPSTLQEIDQIGSKEITRAIGKLVRDSYQKGSLVHIADLEKSVARNQKKLAELKKNLISKKSSIESDLKRLLRREGVHDIRYGVVGNMLYVWTRDTNPMNLANAYGSQFFYFESKQEMYNFLRESSQRLGIKGNIRESFKKLEGLYSQMQTERTKFAGKDVSPLGVGAGRIKGEALHFQLDARKQSLQSLEGKISKITGPDGHGGIDRPKFPDGEKLEIAFARLAATVKSDGQLRETGRISYTEANLDRLNQVEKNLQAFGKISLHRSNRRREYETSFPAPLGKALQHMGFRSGDKAILNDGLPPAILESSSRAKSAYLQDLIPEDGNFHPKTGFTWSRSHSLNAGEKGESYGFIDRISKRAVELLRSGTPDAKSTYRTWGELQKLEKSKDPEISERASEIVRVVKSNPNRLINDEAKLARSLGIKVETNPAYVRYSEKSNRVSVHWVGRTTSVNESVKWARQCPPNDERKRKAVMKWLKDRRDTMN